MFNPMYLPNQPTEIFIDTDVIQKWLYSFSRFQKLDWNGDRKRRKKYNVSFRILKTDEKAGKFQLLMTAPAKVFSSPNGFLEKLQSNCGL